MQTTQITKTIWKPILMAGCFALVLACSSQFRTHGYVPSEAQLAEIVIGVDNRDSLTESLGAPSSLGVGGGQSYYYVRSRVRQYGWQRPEVVARQLVAIDFDAGGIVRNVQHYSLQDGRVIALSRRVTDNELQRNTFLRQLLQNLSAFSPGEFLPDPN
ncbi:MAG: outer membrane protein assembly factor BamE [Rhodobacteraceae bacterium]|nr:outer membrane protein assembly factor BamE [Paracoccaceae bacterium]